MTSIIDPLDAIVALFHFTDRRNLPSIRELGGLYSLAQLREAEIVIPAPGGNEWSHDADANKGLDTYVHLCLRANHPMEWTARQQGRIMSSVYLDIRPEVMRWDGVRFTADVSNKAGVEVCSIEEARTMIDFDILYTGEDKRRPEIQERLQRVEKCEILVPNHIPIELIRNFPDD